MEEILLTWKLNWTIKFLRYSACLGEILYIVLIVLCKCTIFSISICKKIWIKDKRKYSDKLRILNDVKKHTEIQEWYQGMNFILWIAYTL